MRCVVLATQVYSSAISIGNLLGKLGPIRKDIEPRPPILTHEHLSAAGIKIR